MNKRWFASGITKSAPVSVDLDKGIISGVAVVTAGGAKGHGVMLDTSFVKDVVEYGNDKKNGIKARFGHPNMCSTALGTFIGRIKNFRNDGDIARADLFMSGEAKDTPHGNLYEYVLGMANNEPDMFGLSIVFTPGDKYQISKDGKKIGSNDDEYDSQKEPFVELSALHACDIVDDPAANPDGLFSAWSADTFAGQATEFFDTHPEVFEVLRAKPEIVNEFLSRYSAEAGTHIVGSVEPLVILEKEEEMKDENKEVKAESEIRKEVKKEELARFEAMNKAFPGDLDFAAEHYKAGSSVAEAKAAYADVLVERLAAAKAENEELKSTVEAAVAVAPKLVVDESAGGAPVGFESEKGDKTFDELVEEKMSSSDMKIGDAIEFCVANHPKEYAIAEKGAK